MNSSEKFNIYQGDEFTPHFKIASFDDENKAKKQLKIIENESIKYDAFNCFYIKKESNEPIKNISCNSWKN